MIFIVFYIYVEELDQLHHFKSITITITPSNLSITLQLQLFCANKIKLQLHLFSHLQLITS